MKVQVEITVSDRLVEYVRERVKDAYGRYPSDELLQDFFCTDIEAYYNEQPLSQEFEDAAVTFFYVVE